MGGRRARKGWEKGAQGMELERFGKALHRSCNMADDITTLAKRVYCNDLKIIQTQSPCKPRGFKQRQGFGNFQSLQAEGLVCMFTDLKILSLTTRTNITTLDLYIQCSIKVEHNKTYILRVF